MNTQPLLFEAGTEEIPVSYFVSARDELKKEAKAVLEKARLSFKNVEVLGTPRRITLIVNELSDRQAPQTKEVRGPSKASAYDKDGNPSKALLGFIKSQGVDLSSIIVKEENGKNYIYAIVKDEGKSTTQVLTEILPNLILRLSFPKVMRWEVETQGCQTNIAFARPIRWLLCLYGNQVVPVRIGRLTAGRETYGHRFLSPSPLKINNINDYKKQLKQEWVIVDPEERLEEIKKELERQAQKIGGRLYEMSYNIIEELVHLVEYPTVFSGKFENMFLSLPSEVLTTVMIHHQRYVPIENNASLENITLLPAFLGVRNGNKNHLSKVVEGNERVLRARLSDAVYFFQKDKEISLKERSCQLDRLVFQKDLGTYGAKTRRIEKLCDWILPRILISDELIVKSIQEFTGNSNILEDVKKTAFICKADLLTQMVFEFPELQGIMGKIYAKESGEALNIAAAIEEHYLPRGADDKLPSTMEGVIVGLADRVDTLAGCFGLGLIPSGSSDPYGLRRAVLGIISVILHHKLVLNLNECFSEAFKLYLDAGILKGDLNDKNDSLLEFVYGRFQGELLARFQKDSIQNDLISVVPRKLACKDIHGTLEKVTLLAAERKEHPNEFSAQVIAAVRVFNILPKDKKINPELLKVNPELLEDNEERNLWNAYLQVEPVFSAAISKRNWSVAWGTVSSLIDNINLFFDTVLVMTQDEKIRENRLVLLSHVNSLFYHFGNLSKIITE